MSKVVPVLLWFGNGRKCVMMMDGGYFFGFFSSSHFCFLFFEAFTGNEALVSYACVVDLERFICEYFSSKITSCS